jgi:Tfp pilus assembly protein PilZ
MEVSCQTTPGGPDIAVVPLDGSVGGVGLLVSEPLAEGQEVHLTLRQPKRATAHRTGVVRWCKPVYGDIYRVGIQLNPKPLPPELPSESPPPNGRLSADARRNRERRTAKGSCVATCRRTGQTGDLALALMDVSETGVRLLLTTAVSEGQAVIVTLRNLRHPEALERSGTVRWCVPTAQGSHCAGVELDPPLAFADVQRLT